MKFKIFTIQFWKATFGFKKSPSEVSKKPPEQESMSQELSSISQSPEAELSRSKKTEKEEKQKEKLSEPKPTKVAKEEHLTKTPAHEKVEGSTVRSELNLEKNAVFTVSTYKKKSRELVFRETSPEGEITERKMIVGRTAEGIETGVLTTNHFKTYLVLLEFWEKAGRPINEPVHFTTYKIIRRLDLKDDGRTYAGIKRALYGLRQIPVEFIDSFVSPKEGTLSSLKPFTVLNHLRIYERKNVGKQQKTRGYGEFQFDRYILESLVNNYTHPLRLDIIKSFRKHKDLAILLYTYLDRNLATRDKYEIGLETLFDHLDLSQDYIPYPAKRKHRIEPVLKELEGKPLSTGILSYCRIHRTKDDKDYKLVCRKRAYSKELKPEEAPVEWNLPTAEPESEEPEPVLLSLLVQKGLTQKQAGKLLSEEGEEVVRVQLAYLPFRLEEYKAQKKEFRPAAILYDSIKHDWQPPKSFLEAEKEKERGARRQALEEEFQERVKKAKAEAEEWAARSPEDRITAMLESWLWSEKQFSEREPPEEEIDAKKKELIANIRTKEEYEQDLIHQIEIEFQTKLGGL